MIFRFFIFYILILLFFSCKTLFVNIDTIKELENKYSGLYIAKSEIDIGNNETLKKGSVIKLYFRSTKNYLIVYGYDRKQNRENAIGKNILMILKDDSTNKKKIFEKKLLEEKLKEILRPYRR